MGEKDTLAQLSAKFDDFIVRFQRYHSSRRLSDEELLAQWQHEFSAHEPRERAKELADELHRRRGSRAVAGLGWK